MGDWMTVRLEGTCDPADVPALRKALDPGEDYANFHCLSSGPGICGLGDWAAPTIDRVGNVAERDYDAQDVAKALGNLAKAAPSLRLKVHCGGPYEDKACVATVTLDGENVRVGPPEVAAVGEIPTEQMTANLLAALSRPRSL